jgi:hypothetical protein
LISGLGAAFLIFTLMPKALRLLGDWSSPTLRSVNKKSYWGNYSDALRSSKLPDGDSMPEMRLLNDLPLGDCFNVF